MILLNKYQHCLPRNRQPFYVETRSLAAKMLRVSGLHLSWPNMNCCIRSDGRPVTRRAERFVASTALLRQNCGEPIRVSRAPANR